MQCRMGEFCHTALVPWLGSVTAKTVYSEGFLDNFTLPIRLSALFCTMEAERYVSLLQMVHG